MGDHLRACRAKFDDLTDILNGYTSRPTPAELAAKKAVAKVVAELPADIASQAAKYDAKTTVAQRFARKPALSARERVKRVVNLAAAAGRRKRLDLLVKYLEEEVGPGLVLSDRQFLSRLAAKLWGALTSTRGRDPYVRVRRLAHVVGGGVAENVLAPDKVRLVRDRVVELFGKLEATGGFGPVTPAKPCHQRTALERDQRGLTPGQIARRANISEALGDAMKAVQTKGRPSSESVAWYNWLTLLVSAAYDTQPGTPERQKALDDALKDRPDKELARKFAALALSGLDQQLHRA